MKFLVLTERGRVGKAETDILPSSLDDTGSESLSESLQVVFHQQATNGRLTHIMMELKQYTHSEHSEQY